MTSEVEEVLTPHQREITRRVLDEESLRRNHLVVSLSGAHAYGFPSPNSDLDLKAVHVDATAELLGFPRTPPSAERLEVIEGVEIDYSSNEIGPVLLGVLKGNGNYVERFLSGFLVSSAEGVEALATLVAGALSRKLARHYRGFGGQLLREWEADGRRSAKKLLYVLRTTLTGVHVLRTGQVVTDVQRLLKPYGLEDALELVAEKRRGEKAELPDALRARWAERVPALFELLDAAERESPLPVEATNAGELERWLIAHRLVLLERRG